MSQSEQFQRLVEPGVSLRLDRYIAEVWQLCSRSQLPSRALSIVVNGVVRKASYIVAPADEIVVTLQAVSIPDLRPEPLALAILYEDADVLVVNKPSGLVVHPAAGNWSGTLVHGLLHHIQELATTSFNDNTRPGIVHRLDKETSGVLIVAKHPRGHDFLARQFANRQTIKTYLALAGGQPASLTFRVEGCLRRDPRHRQKFAWHETLGKAARTDFVITASNDRRHLVQAQPYTGRTHQIRVHLQHAGLPILGDTVYGQALANGGIDRCMLHAWKLTIQLPSGSGACQFIAPPPADFRQTCATLGLGEL
jgi:23S rRNA pseudouridine1911/1915/1917 synthase